MHEDWGGIVWYRVVRTVLLGGITKHFFPGMLCVEAGVAGIA